MIEGKGSEGKGGEGTGIQGEPKAGLSIANGSLVVETGGRGLIEITPRIQRWIGAQPFTHGVLTLFIRHTSASLLIQENADPDVVADLERFFARLVPDGDPIFTHVAEGPDDMPAHVRAALLATSLSIPLVDARLALGTWQGVYLYEHRIRRHRRELVLSLVGL